MGTEHDSVHPGEVRSPPGLLSAVAFMKPFRTFFTLLSQQPHGVHSTGVIIHILQTKLPSPHPSFKGLIGTSGWTFPGTNLVLIPPCA